MAVKTEREKYTWCGTPAQWYSGIECNTILLRFLSSDRRRELLTFCRLDFAIVKCNRWGISAFHYTAVNFLENLNETVQKSVAILSAGTGNRRKKTAWTNGHAMRPRTSLHASTTVITICRYRPIGNTITSSVSPEVTSLSAIRRRGWVC